MRKIAEIIELIRHKKNLKSETAVAEILGMTQPALNKHKQRDSIPYDQLTAFCIKENISLDWLLLGREDLDTENFKATINYLENKVFELTEKLRDLDEDFARDERCKGQQALWENEKDERLARKNSKNKGK